MSRYLIYPGTLLASLAAAWVLRDHEAFAVSGVVVCAGAFILFAERRWPRSEAWRPTRVEWWRDLFGSVVWHSVLPAALHGLFAAAAVALGRQLGLGGLWPTTLWLPLQVYLALAAAELGHYASHRLFHQTGWGWALHQVHHSTARMHFLASGRNHPLNVATGVLLKLLTLAVLEVPAEVVMLAACFNGVNGLLQHANVRQTTPFIDWVLATPDLHVWHHSKKPELANANYGSNVILWDVVFGTRLKRAPEPPLDVGLHYELPPTLLGQLATPFRRLTSA